MNDRFIFRVWYKQGKEFFGGIYPGVMALPNTSNEEAFVLEQCTGLKDKNGNLIYENDIVELTDDDSFEKPIKTIVRWAEENACFGLFGSHNLYYSFASYDSDNFEVIGNIHENPELLEDK